mmetsp:Transcript_8301/g.12782  ORF Transcript_8301/g.12782 Transcript_8301/m.12782 type:complete len:313 (+) Transcript_8301:84-1022(+)
MRRLGVERFIMLLVTLALFQPCGSVSLTTMSTAIISNTRGGALFGLIKSKGKKKKNAKETYRQTLEDQIQNLERQVRSAKEESSQFRKMLKLASSSSRGASFSLQKELQLLQKQIEHLEIFQAELEKLLKEEVKRNVDLQNQLTNADMDVKALREQHKGEMEALEKALLKTGKAQLEKVTKLMEERIKEAAERARMETMLEMEAKLKEALRQAEAKAEHALAEERRKGAEAVENERVKMRKLIKALADREKKAVAGVQEKFKKKMTNSKKKKKHTKNNDNESETSKSNVVSIKSSIKSKRRVLPSPNVRSPI